jgi:hypothetical protein
MASIGFYELTICFTLSSKVETSERLSCMNLITMPSSWLLWDLSLHSHTLLTLVKSYNKV